MAAVRKPITYSITGTNSYGCTATAVTEVVLLCDENVVFIPNTFTPNGDGQNDLFFPRGVGVKKISSFRVYDRWGGLVFERENIDINDEQNGWDGRCKGNAPRPDVYVYAIDAMCETGETISWKGDVTIIR